MALKYAYTAKDLAMGESSDLAILEPGVRQVSWSVRLAGELIRWDWSSGEPPVRNLEPVRRIPRGRFKSRGVPGRVASGITGGWVGFESGLEYSLVRQLERDRGIEWLVSQPVLLDGERRHTPDYLEVRRGGVTRLWDARPRARRDEAFEVAAALTRRACAIVGWEYEVFEGLSEVEELNSIWLYGHRRVPLGFDRMRHGILCDAHNAPTLGALLATSRSRPEYVSAVWHLVWLGEIGFDLSQPITENVVIHCAGDVDG